MRKQMSKQIKLNSPQSLFIIKTAACFAALLIGFFVLSPTASMQDSAGAPPPMPANTAVVVMSNSNGQITGNYRPTPEPPKSTVRGRVIYGDTGRAVRRAGLMMMPVKGAGGGRENAGVTNERGEFEIKGVVEGRYFVSVSTPGVLTPFSALTNLDKIGAMSQDSAAYAEIAKDFQEVVVNGINDADVMIVVKRGAAITGRIMYADGEAAIGVRVEVLRKKNGQYNAVVPNLSEVFGAMFGGAAGGLKTDDRGVYRVAGLPAGEYVVRAVENVTHSEKANSRDDEFMAMTGFNPSSMVSTFYPNTPDVKKAETLKIEIGQEQSEINITIPERALHGLRGVAVNRATRAPLKNARVSIKSDDNVNSLFGGMNGGGEFGTKNETDEQGRWSFRELPAGKYTLTIEPPYDYKSDDESKNPQKAKPPKLARAQKEIVIEEKDIADLTVELGYGASISGTVSFDNGEAFSQQIFVSATDENRKFLEVDSIGSPYYDEGSRPAPKKTQEFKIEGIAAGKVFLYAGGSGALGGESGSAEQQFYVKSILFNGRDIKGAALETKEGGEIKGVSIVLARDVGKLKGTVVRADKSTAAGARILLVPTDKGQRENSATSIYATTGAGGEFEISGAPGEYFIVLYTEDDSNREENKDKTVAEQSREWLERKIADAQKVTIKAKETEKITLTVP